VLASTTISPPTVRAADPRASVPDQVDARILDQKIAGPVLATGQGELPSGAPAAGALVVAQAWPNRDTLASMKVGDGFPEVTVGWAEVEADGSYTMRVDPSLLTPDRIGDNGKVQLELIAWTPTREGRWGETAWLGSADEAVVLATRAPATVREARSFKAKVTLTEGRRTLLRDRTAEPTSARAANLGVTAAGCTPGYPWWYLLSTYNTQYVIGQTWPWASGQKGWMKTKSTHESSIQYGVSATGKTGSWSAGGSYSENDGTAITMTWAKNSAFRDYTVREQFGNYALAYCGTTNYTSWKEYPIQPTGTYSYLASSGAAHFQAIYCDTQGLEPGTAERQPVVASPSRLA
jgi:hypothetical protein